MKLTIVIVLFFVFFQNISAQEKPKLPDLFEPQEPNIPFYKLPNKNLGKVTFMADAYYRTPSRDGSSVYYLWVKKPVLLDAMPNKKFNLPNHSPIKKP